VATASSGFSTYPTYVILRSVATITSRDEANNRSLVSVDVFIDVTGSASSDNVNVSVTNAGNTISVPLGYLSYGTGSYRVVNNFGIWITHNANGELASSGFAASATSSGWGTASNSGTLTGFTNYDRKPATPTFGTISRDVRSVTVNVNVTSSPAGAATYTVTRSEDGGAYGDSRTGQSVTYTNLALGSTQRFQATANNSDGTSAAVTSGDTSIPNVPTAPTISVASSTDRTVTAGVSSNNGATVTRYSVAVSANNGASWASAVTMDGNRQHTFTGLTPGGVYQFRVASENEMGESSITTSGSYTVPNVPDAPTITVGTVSGRAVTVSCGVSANNGSTVTGYTVQASPDDGVTWETLISIPSRAYRFENLVGGAIYRWRVFAQNEVGPSEYRTSESTFIPSGGRRWNGTAWVSTATAKRWNGTAWVELTTAKRLTSTGWVDLT
jgi:hypothetical protein